MINVMSDNGKTGTNVLNLVADTAADISNLQSQWSDKCAPGSTAVCVETGDKYMMKSTGTWNRQNAEPGSPAVDSVNGKTGVVILDATDVGALPDDTALFSGAYADLSGKPTLGTASALDVAESGNASSTQVVKGDDTRLTDSRTPTSHTHTKSDITDFPDMTDYVEKSETAGLIKNDGTIDTNTYLTQHQDITGKADKVDSATNGNFAGLDANGNLTDSGKKASDFLTATDLAAKVPDAPEQDGTYTLKVTVSSGTATFSWVSDI